MQNSQLMSFRSELLFLRVIENGSLKAVAEEIGSNPSAVSRRIAALEARLGTKLLQRSTKGSQPTEAGRRYYEGMRQILGNVTALETEVTGLTDQPSGLLRVAAPVDFGARYVAPVLAELHKHSPKLEIDLRLGSEFTAFVEQRIDVAIRIGNLANSNLIARKLGTVSRVIVASPSYLEQNGTPLVPQDLENHPFIFYQSNTRNLTFVLGIGKHSHGVTVAGHLSVNNVSSIRHLLLSDLGLHLGPRWAFETDIKAGRLIAILPEYALLGFPLHALYERTAYLPAKIRLFIDRMVEAIKSENSLT